MSDGGEVSQEAAARDEGAAGGDPEAAPHTPPRRAGQPGGAGVGSILLGALNPFSWGARTPPTGGGAASAPASAAATPQQQHEAAPSEYRRTPSSGEGKEYTYQDWAAKMKAPEAARLFQQLKGVVHAFQSRARASPEELHATLKKVFGNMARHPLWKDASRAELDAASESLEKFVVGRLHGRFFPGTEQDREEDARLAERVELLQFVEPRHLEIPPVFFSRGDVVERAAAEMRRVNDFKAPRDKIVCLLNCCKIVLDHLESFREQKGKREKKQKKKEEEEEEEEQAKGKSEADGDGEEEEGVAAAGAEAGGGAGGAGDGAAQQADQEEDCNESNGSEIAPPPMPPPMDDPTVTPHAAVAAKDAAGPKEAAKARRMAATTLSRPPSVDDFLPILIYLVMRSRTPALLLNLRYVTRMRNPRRLAGEPLCYLTNIESAIHFVLNSSPAQLDMDPAEFEARMAEGAARIEALRREEAERAEREARERREAEEARSVERRRAVLEGRLSFYRTEESDLRVADVPRLLAEYKLVAEALIKRQLEDGLGAPPPDK